MTRQDAERAIAEYLKPIFGFALKRCKTPQDAEDLSQEIVLKAFHTLLLREDIADVGKFIWTMAHHALSNYYRDTARTVVGLPAEDGAEGTAEGGSFPDEAEDEDALRRLQTEIAYLSRLQRSIVIAYYFENRRQTEISQALGIPLGTVKWHLFEAKKELKRGMDTMRKSSELKFHPIRFHSCGINGTIGTKAPDEFLRSTLSQNICYCVRRTAQTVNEVADALGVSPVYVETEMEYLEEYGFLTRQKEKYLANFLMDEPTAAFLTLQHEMYARAAALFAPALLEELENSGLMEHPDLVCGQTDGALALNREQKADRNFLLWSLIPYITAWSGDSQGDGPISFEEVATVRPDGGHNIFHASVVPEVMALPEDYVYMNNWCGPMWHGSGSRILWQLDTEWSAPDRHRAADYARDAQRVLSLYEKEGEDRLTGEEYAWLAERGYVKTVGHPDGLFKSSWQIVLLRSPEIQEKLLALGRRVREKCQGEFASLKAPYNEAVLAEIPAHLRKIRAYELQFLFGADGWFLAHCIAHLMREGKLHEPTQGQKKALSTLIVYA